MGSADAIVKLQSLSEERAKRVFALIEDLAELEALEDAEDVMDARIALAEVEEADTQFIANERRSLEERQPPRRPAGVQGGEAEPAQGGEGNPPAERPTIPYDELRRELGLDR